MPQVLIVGAGPVGLTAAIELARYGVSVRIVDKAAARSVHSKALVVWPRTLELLDRIGLADGFVAAGLRAQGMRMIGDGAELARVAVEEVPSPFPYALLLPQNETERLLEEHLATLGVTVERETELLIFSESGSSIHASLRHGDDEEEVLADYLLGCDGAHSTVRHILGLAFEGHAVNRDWALADVHLEASGLPAEEVSIVLHHEGMCGIFPIGGDRVRVLADVGPETSPAVPSPSLADMQALVSRRLPQGGTLSDPIWLSGFRINERMLSQFREERVFLLGDAAHIHSPAGGQGMNTGMQDAFNLCWKLAFSLRGPVPDHLLDSYSEERVPVVREVLRSTGQLTAMGMVRAAPLQAIRNFAAHFVLGLSGPRHALAEKMTELSVGYPHSTLNGSAASGGHGPAPGERMPPAKGGTAPAGPPRFAVYAAPGAVADRILSTYPDLVEPSLRPPPDDSKIWLVRPDGYVAVTATPEDTTGLVTWLNHWRL